MAGSTRRFALLIPVILMFLMVSCATTGPGGQKSLILIPTSQEIKIGQQLNQRVQEADTLLADTAWQNYIDDIGQRIVAVSDRSDLPFHFAVIESDQINAFAAPGGFVFFYTGLLREMDSESELAAVMAHEISHIVARHSIKQLQLVMPSAMILELAAGGESETVQTLAGVALGIVMSGYSRSMESEADRFGAIYMTRAGWHPEGMIDMFEKLQELSGEHDMSFFEMLAASHPQTSDRIAATRAQIVAMTDLSPQLIQDTQRFHRMRERLPAKKENPAAPASQPNQ
jgi:predicted Zn-dependent protease